MSDTLIGTVLTMNDMVAYQDGSVVSRTLINKEPGTITLFAFDKGESLSEHTAPYDAFVHVFDGIARITISGIPYTLCAGQTIIMPANKPHRVDADQRFKMMLVMIRA